jgi:hypothetical protein
MSREINRNKQKWWLAVSATINAAIIALVGSIFLNNIQDKLYGIDNSYAVVALASSICTIVFLHYSTKYARKQLKK